MRKLWRSNFRGEEKRETSNKRTDSPPHPHPPTRSRSSGQAGRAAGAWAGASVRGAAGAECACSPQRNRHKQRLKPPQKQLKTRSLCGESCGLKCGKRRITANFINGTSEAPPPPPPPPPPCAAAERKTTVQVWEDKLQSADYRDRVYRAYTVPSVQ